MVKTPVVLGVLGALVIVSGCTAEGAPEPTISLSVRVGPFEEPSPEASPGVVVLDLSSPVPDAIEAGVVQVALDDAPSGRLLPDGSFLVGQVTDEGERFGNLDTDSGEVSWLTGDMTTPGESWFSPVGVHGEWLVLRRQWNEKAEHSLDEGMLLAVRTTDGTVVDLTQAPPGDEARAGWFHAEVVGGRVYWVEGDGTSYVGELGGLGEVSVLAEDSWIELDQCVTSSAGHPELLVWRGEEVLRLGPDGELRGRGAEDVHPNLRSTGLGSLECAGWTVSEVPVDLEDGSSSARLELVDGDAVTHFVAPDWVAFTVDALSESWLVFRASSATVEEMGSQFVYDRRGQQLYRLPPVPFAGGMQLARDGEVFVFTADSGMGERDGSSYRDVIGSLSSPAG